MNCTSILLFIHYIYWGNSGQHEYIGFIMGFYIIRSVCYIVYTNSYRLPLANDHWYFCPHVLAKPGHVAMSNIMGMGHATQAYIWEITGIFVKITVISCIKSNWIQWPKAASYIYLSFHNIMWPGNSNFTIFGPTTVVAVLFPSYI